MTQVKAQLISKDTGVKAIEFMFNPTELTFEKSIETSENKGARTQDKGQPKVGFANPKAGTLTINKIMFDTYETGENVLKYIEPLRKAVQFNEKLVAEKKERTPMFSFIWGSYTHMRCCFIEKLSYKLTMFLPDGTPVRAVIDSLTLKEADEPKPNVELGAAAISQAMRQSNSMANRQNGRSNPNPTTGASMNGLQNQ